MADDDVLRSRVTLVRAVLQSRADRLRYWLNGRADRAILAQIEAYEDAVAELGELLTRHAREPRARIQGGSLCAPAPGRRPRA